MSGTDPGIVVSRSARGPSTRGSDPSKPSRVRVHRVAEDLLDRRELLNLASVHDRDPIAHLGDDGEVVGDQQNRGVLLPRLHLEHQIQNLRLDGHVERRRRLVGDQEIRCQRKRHRDHDPLALASGELMRILLHSRGRVGNPDELEHLDAAVEGLLLRDLLVLQVHLHQLEADREHRVQRRHGLLKDHADLVAAHVANAFIVQLQQIASLEHDFAGDNSSRRTWNEAQDAQRRDALARAGLADQSDDFAGIHAEIDAVDRFRDTGFGVEIGAQPANVEQGSLLRRSIIEKAESLELENSFGSNASRTASPMKTTSRSVTNSAPSGNKTSHHFVRFSVPWLMSSPQLGVGAGRPKPEEIERHEGADVRDDDERRERHDRRQRVRQNVAKHDVRFRYAGRDRGADVVSRFLTIELATNVVRDRSPIRTPQE